MGDQLVGGVARWRVHAVVLLVLLATRLGDMPAPLAHPRPSAVGASAEFSPAPLPASGLPAIDKDRAGLDIVALLVDRATLDNGAPDAAAAVISVQVHIVRSGETLAGIAARYEVAVDELAVLNRLPNPDLIWSGQAIELPAGASQAEPWRAVSSVEPEATAPADLTPGPAVAPASPSSPAVAALDQSLRALSRVLGEWPAEANGSIAEPQLAASATRGSSVQSAPIAANRSNPTVDDGSMAADGRVVEYTIRPGETLRNIASRFGVDLNDLARRNGLADPNRIAAGAVLRVAPGVVAEHEVKGGEKLLNIATYYGSDLIAVARVNRLADPNLIRPGQILLMPSRAEVARPTAPIGSAARRSLALSPTPPATLIALIPRLEGFERRAGAAVTRFNGPSAGGVNQVTTTTGLALPPAARLLGAPGVPPLNEALAGPGGQVVKQALQFLGYPYVWGGTAPSGFDCSGFIWYVHRLHGRAVPRDLLSQLNGPREELRPGVTVFFENTYMPGPSHNGIYIGEGRFVHAADEKTGVIVSNLGDAYWRSRFIGARRLY